MYYFLFFLASACDETRFGLFVLFFFAFFSDRIFSHSKNTFFGHWTVWYLCALVCGLLENNDVLG